MTNYELLKPQLSYLSVLVNNGLSLDFVKYVPLYEEYKQLMKSKQKTSYIVALLSGKYGISERAIYRIVKKLKKKTEL